LYTKTNLTDNKLINNIINGKFIDENKCKEILSNNFKFSNKFTLKCFIKLICEKIKLIEINEKKFNEEKIKILSVGKNDEIDKVNPKFSNGQLVFIFDYILKMEEMQFIIVNFFFIYFNFF
jgi:hypothetical protein